MENEQLIGTLRSSAEALKNKGFECTAAVVKLAAERLEWLECYNENLKSANAHVLGTLQDEIENAKAEVARYIIGIIEQRMAVNTERLKASQSNIYKIGYKAENEAYKDIKEIIEQEYTEE